MEKRVNYHDQLQKDNIKKLREIISTLPPFCSQYFRGMDNSIASRTKLAYAYDLRLFFQFLVSHVELFKNHTICNLSLECLDQITREDIEEYLLYLSLYDKHYEDKNENELSREITNEERGKSRKLSSLRSFYNFYFKNELIKTNAPSLVPVPKQHDKEIVRLDPNEVATLLDQVEDGSKLTKKQLEYHKKTKVRDVTILTLLLGTGIRVSECVGLDIQDVDLDNLGIKVRRKGGYEDVVYFGDEVEVALIEYLEKRKHQIPSTGHENALFLSLQNRRITTRSVENLVKKYASLVTSLKKITPHKLRSTFGTTLYQETGDIYLVADVLGHKDVNTTRKHYAAMKDENKRKAAKTIKLREP
ncbi:MAG: tyrosine-type recombinase/integrase [Lachnospiraceae bacterium]